MDVYAAIETRRSVRVFEQPVSEEQLRKKSRENVPKRPEHVESLLPRLS